MIIHRKRVDMSRGRPKSSLSLGMVLCAGLLLSIGSASALSATPRQGLKIDRIVQNWITEETVEVEVCLKSGQRIERSSLTQYDLLVTNDLGGYWRESGVSQKTDHRLCFPGVTLKKKDLAKTLTYTVTESKGNRLIEEMETFLIVPEITPMSQDIYEMCWENPGDLRFFLNQESQPQHTFPFTCQRCCRYLVSQNPGDVVTLETAGAKDSFVRQLVRVLLPENLAENWLMKPHAGLVTLTIKELHKVPSEGDPSGKSQNLKVVLDPHEALQADDFLLSLIAGSKGNQTNYPLLKIIDATQLVFEGNFVDSNFIMIIAMKDGGNVGVGSVQQDVIDPGSRVAKVGDASAPSLRVDPGARDQVEVPGKPPCVRGSGPCYYVGQSDPPPPLCEDLPGIIFCDAVVSQLQNPAEVPALELRNRQELRVQQPRPDGARTEVVVSSDDSILSPDGFGCDDQGDGTCAQPVAVADDLDGFDATLVVLDDQGYVTASLAVPFEVHGVAALSLSQDVLQVAVDPRSGGTYEVTLAGSSPPPAAALECQAGSPCRFWFAGVDAVDAPPAVSVRKGSNAIYEDISAGPPPPASRVERLTSRGAKMDVEVASDEPVTRADLVTFRSDVATDADCENLAATPLESGYSVAASSRGAGDWNFMVVGYGDGGALLEAGRAHVTLADISLPRMTKVGTEAFQSLKVETGGMDVKVNGFLCPASTICYDLEPENILDPPEVCRMATPSIEQCDVTATYISPEVLSDPSVELWFKGVPVEDLIVTADFSSTSLLMEAKLYTSSEALTPTLSCDISGRAPRDCVFKVERNATEFKILLMALGAESVVTESSVVEFEDFMTRVQHFNDGTDLEVRWRASSEQTFSVSTEDDVSRGSTETSITCGQELRTCKAYFTKLNAGAVQKVKVTKDKTAVSVSVQPGQDDTPPLSIARISRVSASPPQAQLTISSDVDVAGAKYLEFVVIEPSVGGEIVQHIAFADFSDVIHAGSLVTFEDVEAPKTGVEVTVMVVAHAEGGEDSAALAFGKALVAFEEIKLPQMTKVGTGAFQSLRVKTGEMEVEVNGFLCPASTICYDLEPENILEPPEVCRMSGPTLEQCDMTAAYTESDALISLSVQLRFTGAPKEDLMITADFSETSLTMEAKLYTNPVTLTDKPLTCEITGRSPKTCTFKVEPKETEFKILLMALDSESTVKESTVVEFEDFQTRIRQLTSEAIEVRWRASQSQEYDVEIAPEIEGKRSNSSVLCGGAKPEDLCWASFLSLGLNETYTASVRTRNSEKKVSATVQMEPVMETIEITDLTLAKREDTDTELTVCFSETQPTEKTLLEKENILYKLVTEDANGLQLRMTSSLSPVSFSVVEGKPCLGPLPLDFDFDLTGKVRILVTREDFETHEVAAGDVELFLLDPAQVDVSQVGAKTLRATWTNRNGAPSFEVGMGVGDLSSVECGVGEEVRGACLRYLHANGTSERVTVLLREIGLSVDQQVEVTLTMRGLPDLPITKADVTWDDRLRVCFESNSKDSLYLLGLEDEEDDVQESPQLRPFVEDGLTCVVSKDAIQEEGYVSLWTLLTAYDVSGAEVQASGSTNVTDFFLNPRRRVSAAVNSGTRDLLVSWFLLSDPRSISSYDVTLEETAAGGSNKAANVGNTESSLVFSDTTPGRYSVCVVASVEERNMTSRRVCSAIFSILQEEVTVPEIEEVELKSSGQQKVLVTWKKPQVDVSSYVVTWPKNTSFSSSSSYSSSSSSSSSSLPRPLSSIRAATPRAQKTQDPNFQIVPASTHSLEVSVVDSEKHIICVSSVKSDVMGSQTCGTVDQGDYQPLDPPKDLTHEDEVLHWADVLGAVSYLVEWQPDHEGGLSEGGQKEVIETSWPTHDLTPGAWVLEVRAVSNTSVSETANILITKPGIVIDRATQTSNSRLEVSWWEEPFPSCGQTPCEYTITLYNTRANYMHSCSGQRGDCTKLLDLDGTPEIAVKVERNSTSNLVKRRVYDLPAVAELRQSFSSGGEEVELAWAPSEEARFYNVTLFADAALASVRKAETISRETYILTGSNLAGIVFSVQPCQDEYHCGDPLPITIQETSDYHPTTDDTAVIIVAVVGGLVAVIVIVSFVILAVRETSKSKKRDRRRQQEAAAMSGPVYNEWGARPLGQTPHLPLQRR